MKRILDYLDESLFTADRADSDKVAQTIDDKLRLDDLVKHSVKRIGQSEKKVELKMENGELTINVDGSPTDVLDVTFASIHDPLMPLNIKALTGTCRNLFVTFRSCPATTISDLFTQDFKNELRSSMPTPLILSITNCRRLKSFEGCPDHLQGLYLMYNGTSFDDTIKSMPTWVDKRFIYIGSDDRPGNVIQFDIDVTNCNFENYFVHNAIDRNKKYVQMALDIYHHLDPKCGVAKYMKPCIEECNMDPKKKTVNF